MKGYNLLFCIATYILFALIATSFIRSIAMGTVDVFEILFTVSIVSYFVHINIKRFRRKK
ncbi:MAG: hypothetical protein ABF289_18445 [Clostridiales bacterium]